MAFAPFGERYDLSGAAPVDFAFSGNNNDTDSLTYDAIARKEHSSQGRWISPDPAGLGAEDPSNPQTWNRYSYVMNNPLNFIDPLGLSCEDLKDGQPCVVDVKAIAPPVPTFTIELDGYIAGAGFDLARLLHFRVAALRGVRLKAANNGNNCQLTFSQRAQMFGNGLLNLGIAGVKLSAAAGVEAGTSGVGTALALYGVYRASGNVATGLLQTVGAFMPNAGQWQQAASVSTAAGSVAGLTTLAATGGNVGAAVHAFTLGGNLPPRISRGCYG